ncbi:MAG: hypothetical protein LC715_08675 [Gammaproteobacteria bacterium]|nr:hypothetical protein [Gammaproteobacteria bacterium]
MLNSVAAGRRLARRTVGFQAIATAATALVCLSLDGASAAGALAGGTAMTLGSALAAWRALGGGVVGSGVALGRLIGATALKWMLVVVGLYLALAVWQLPPGPVFAGVVVAALAWLPAAMWASRAGQPDNGSDGTMR